jgi:hypothetical protein
MYVACLSDPLEEKIAAGGGGACGDVWVWA